MSRDEERFKTGDPRAYARARAGTPKKEVPSTDGGPTIEVLPDPPAVAKRAAEQVAEWARRAVADHGSFTFAVSGGHTPWAMFAALAGEEMPWEHTTIFQVDERVAPAGDEERNLTHLQASLPASVGTGPGTTVEIHPMPVEDQDLESAAARYAQLLPRRFDLIHLGLGPDGHTASLVPGDPVLEVSDRDVALTGVYQGRRRMTLTYPVLGRARAILWLVTGADKVDALARLRDGDASIPAGRVAARRASIVADEAAITRRPRVDAR